MATSAGSGQPENGPFISRFSPLRLVARMRGRLNGTVVHGGLRVTQGSMIALYNGEDVLLVRQRLTADWGFPGGFLKRAELPSEGAKRELLEETGISLSITEEDRRMSYVQPWARHLDHVFVLELDSIPVSAPRGDRLEISRVAWVSSQHLPRLRPETALALKRISGRRDRD